MCAREKDIDKERVFTKRDKNSVLENERERERENKVKCWTLCVFKSE